VPVDDLIGVDGLVAHGGVDVAVAGDELSDVRWHAVQDGVSDEQAAEVVRGEPQRLTGGDEVLGCPRGSTHPRLGRITSAPTSNSAQTRRLLPIPAGHRRGIRCVRRVAGCGCAELSAAAVVGENLGDHVAGHRREIQLGGGQVGVPEDPLDVGQRQLRIAGHPVGGGMSQVVQGPVGAQRGGGPAEHRPRRVVGQGPQRPAPGPPQRVVAPGRQRLVALALVEPQPHERIRGRRQLLQRSRPLADHRDQLLAGVDVAAAHTEQFRGARPGRHPQRDQRPVPMRAELGEHPVEHLVGDGAGDPLSQTTAR
jgi:hypothetical protein